MPTTVEEQIEDLNQSITDLVAAVTFKKSELDAAVMLAGVSKMNWQGPWATATTYAQNDVVEEAGSSYICVAAHTSDVFATDLSGLNWELIVSIGPQGIQGPAGSQLLSATVPPTPSDGSDDDHLIDTNTNTLYGPKAGGAWPAGVSLVGPQGPSGLSVPPGGASGKVLKKASATDYDYIWDDPAIAAAWAAITGTPTTLAGYGITDGYTTGEVDSLVGAKLDASQVLTPVPAGAVFTDNDTVYVHPAAHAISEVTGLQPALDSKSDNAHNHDADYLAIAGTAADSSLLNAQAASFYLAWANLTGIPSTFPPAVHDHSRVYALGSQNAEIHSNGILRVRVTPAGEVTIFGDVRVEGDVNATGDVTAGVA